MGVRDTSLLAYVDIRDNGNLTRMQEQVFRIIIYSDVPMTNKEIAKMAGLDINCVTPRVGELRNMTIMWEDKNYRVVDAGKRPCTYKPHRMCHTWKAEEV